MSKKSKAPGEEEVLASVVIVGLVEPVLPHILETQRVTKKNGFSDLPTEKAKKVLINPVIKKGQCRKLCPIFKSGHDPRRGKNHERKK